LVGLTPEGPTCGADATWQVADEPAGRGYYLVGDAAAVLDPASSHGVLKALMSGMYAGHLIAQQRLGRLGPEAAPAYYRGWLREWFDRDAARLEAFYAVLAGTASGSVFSTT
jgi:flavin-dependent dehydrogenase